MKNPTVELIDNLLLQGAQQLKQEFGGYKPFFLKKWVNDRLKEQGFKPLNY